MQILPAGFLFQVDLPQRLRKLFFCGTSNLWQVKHSLKKENTGGENGRAAIF
jgi:hypothetical protein